MKQLVIIDYTNWRGERYDRRIRPICIKFDCNEWHREAQWLLEAECVEPGKMGEVRSFALASIHSWKSCG